MDLEAIRILGLAGSLRPGSFNRAALRAAQALAPAGARIEILELAGLPLFDQGQEGSPPAAVVELKARVRAAEAILFVTPEHNYSVPAALKSAIDWGSRPHGDNAWRGKPAAVMGASTGLLGTARAQYHLRQVLVALEMPVVAAPEVMIARAAERFAADGTLTDEPTARRVVQLVTALADLARRYRPQPR